MGSSHNPGEHAVSERNPTVAPQTVAPTDGESTPASQASVNRFTVWLHRISLVVFVIFCIELGVLLAVLPWTSYWVNNGFVEAYPLLKSILQGNFVRGVASGLGLIDISIGIWEAVRYHDPVAERPATVTRE